METQIVLNNFPKTNISVTTFLIGFKNGFYTIFVVAMVTNMTKDTNWHTLRIDSSDNDLMWTYFSRISWCVMVQS